MQASQIWLGFSVQFQSVEFDKFNKSSVVSSKSVTCQAEHFTLEHEDLKLQVLLYSLRLRTEFHFSGVFWRKHIPFQKKKKNHSFKRHITHLFSLEMKNRHGKGKQKGNEWWYWTPLQWTFFSPLSFFYTAGMQRHLQKAFKSNCLMIQLEYNLHPAREWVSKWGWHQW